MVLKLTGSSGTSYSILTCLCLKTKADFHINRQLVVLSGHSHPRLNRKDQLSSSVYGNLKYLYFIGPLWT